MTRERKPKRLDLILLKEQAEALARVRGRRRAKDRYDLFGGTQPSGPSWWQRVRCRFRRLRG